jgi:hypothetical protein
MALLHRKGLVAGKTAYPLAGHLDRPAVTPHHQAMIATHQVAVFDMAQRERGATVGAEILDRRDLAFMPAVENHFLATDPPPQRLFGNFIRRAGDIPSVFGVHERVSRRTLFLFMDPLTLLTNFVVNVLWINWMAGIVYWIHCSVDMPG